ncbi:precorrin-6A reductase [Desmospora profundinema]|uniref:Precorrin-6A/cobalt-precorrin-6A reductase n=1 Tax=Desmospora profundinema TaxID=1571184 RepID=A0ABU1IH96_9BACL|nr:precorrin-6A reductase [Desmospora profundinema]MDR6224141.1 precorrin-6A/cobalt-precorrin-6A reductase [Desmospora profundinema]
MILFLAGTSDAKELAKRLKDAGYALLATVVTEHGAEGLEEAGIPVRVGRLDPLQMAALIREHGCTAVVDASHPFAEEASENAMKASRKASVPYIRYERPAGRYGNHPRLKSVLSYREAAEEAARRPGVVLLTTGSKTLQIFTEVLLEKPEIRLVARMLPRRENLDKCEALGIKQENIIAMQGPFGEELNRALYRHYGVTTVITKESGQAGAVDEKVGSALDMGLDVILIARPRLDYDRVFTEMEAVLAELGKQERSNHHVTRI